MKQEDNSANQQNANKGTDGTDKQYDKAQGNHGQQLDTNIGEKGGSKSGKGGKSGKGK